MVLNNGSLTLAMLSFFSTTVDDFCVILIFFAREYVKSHSMSDPATVLSFVKISIGQFVGFSVIVAISLVLGIGLHSVVNNDYIDLIGLLPILIGLYKVYEILDEAGYFIRLYKIICCIRYSPIIGGNDDTLDNKDIELAVLENPMVGMNGVTQGNKKGEQLEEEKDVTSPGSASPMMSEKTAETEVETDNETEDMKTILNEEALDTLESVDQSSSCVLLAKRMFFFVDPLIFEVGIYALMFGTDNIAIYVALFSNVSLIETAGIVTFFYLMLALYLLIAIFIIVQVRHSLPILDDLRKFSFT